MYYAVVERFGYQYLTIGRTKKEVKEVMTSWYLETYKRLNDSDPREDHDYYDDKSNYDVFIEELGITKTNYGKVESF